MKSAVLPLIIEFSQDKDEIVREATLETIVAVFNLFDNGNIFNIQNLSSKIFHSRNVCHKVGAFSWKIHFGNSDSQKFQNNHGIVKIICTTFCGYETLKTSNFDFLHEYKTFAFLAYTNEEQQKWMLDKFCEIADLGIVDETSDDGNDEDRKVPKYVSYI